MFMDWFRNKYPYTDFHELNFDIFITEFKSFVEALEKLDSWTDTHEEEYKALKEMVDKLLSGDFDPEFAAALNRWFHDNIIDIIGEMCKTVHFGLTNEGYFCAWIPDSWSFLTFDTISDYNDPLFGHLVLKYD